MVWTYRARYLIERGAADGGRWVMDMKHRDRAGSTRTVPAAVLQLATSHLARVRREHQQMQTLVRRPHSPAAAREQAHELTLALQQATQSAVTALRLIERTQGPKHGKGQRRRAARALSAAIQPWSSELMRLSEIEVWLRRTTMDDLGVAVPITVRVGSYAATGPHVPGLGFGSDDVDPAHEPRIGISLREVIDGVDTPPDPVRPAALPASPRRAS
jgi:hypothetical protein